MAGTPRRVRSYAAVRPAGPAPMTTTGRSVEAITAIGYQHAETGDRGDHGRRACRARHAARDRSEGGVEQRAAAGRARGRAAERERRPAWRGHARSASGRQLSAERAPRRLVPTAMLSSPSTAAIESAGPGLQPLRGPRAGAGAP